MDRREQGVAATGVVRALTTVFVVAALLLLITVFADPSSDRAILHVLAAVGLLVFALRLHALPVSFWRVLQYCAAYLGGSAIVMYVNVPVLCLGDGKFDHGCGGYGLYWVIWSVLYAPLVVLGGVLGMSARVPDRWRIGVLSVYIVVSLVAMEVGWLSDATWSVLGHLAIGAAMFWFIAWQLRRSVAARSV